MSISAYTRPAPKPPEHPGPCQRSYPADRARPNPGGDDEERARRPRRESVKGVKDVDAAGLKARD
ncbi:MAG TPA: hypothetical protein VJL61_00955 [Rhodanobacteraceae bacterium]|nr:hypothetical protein [Rhodanobacteraceae bacterium]